MLIHSSALGLHGVCRGATRVSSIKFMTPHCCQRLKLCHDQECMRLGHRMTPMLLNVMMKAHHRWRLRGWPQSGSGPDWVGQSRAQCGRQSPGQRGSTVCHRRRQNTTCSLRRPRKGPAPQIILSRYLSIYIYIHVKGNHLERCNLPTYREHICHFYIMRHTMRPNDSIVDTAVMPANCGLMYLMLGCIDSDTLTHNNNMVVT